MVLIHALDQGMTTEPQECKNTHGIKCPRFKIHKRTGRKIRTHSISSHLTLNVTVSKATPLFAKYEPKEGSLADELQELLVKYCQILDPFHTPPKDTVA